MKGFKRNRLRERGSAARGFHAMGHMVVLVVAAWLAGSVGAIAQGPVRTEPVVVTATRIEEKVSEQASSVSVVTREEIERKGAGFVGDVSHERGPSPRGHAGADVSSCVQPVAAEECAAKGNSDLQRDLVEVVERQREQV